MRQSVPIHIWFEADEGPRFMCGLAPDEVFAAVSDRNIHEFPMDMVCPDCLRAFAGKRLYVQFHITTDNDENDSEALCGAPQPEYLVKGKYSDGLGEEDWCPACKAEWQKRNMSSRA